MKKKLLAAALAACLLVSMAVPAFADTTITTSTSQSGMTNVTYTKAAGYKITIPSDIALTAVNTGVSGTVSASDVVIGAGTTLTVTVESKNGYELVNTSDPTDKLTYTLTPKSSSTTFSSTNKTVLTVASGTADGSASLTATLTEEATKANQYKDTLTFTVSVG